MPDNDDITLDRVKRVLSLVRAGVDLNVIDAGMDAGLLGFIE